MAMFAQPGTIDATFNSTDAGYGSGDGATGQVLAVAVQPDGKSIIGGSFGTYNGTPRTKLARVHPNGDLDTSFDPGTGTNYNIVGIVRQPDGKLLIAGEFSLYNGIPRNGVARVNPDGSLDLSFVPGTGANNSVLSIALQPDGKVLIGGYFTSYNGTARARIARLNADGSLDASFNPGVGVNQPVWSIVLQSDGKVVVGGEFTSYNGVGRNYIARANADGSLDPSFAPVAGANSMVRGVALQTDGKVLIVGNFTTYNGTGRNRVARINSDGSLDGSFDPGTGANNFVFAVFQQADGRVLIGGSFSNVGGSTRNRLARFNTDGTLDGTYDPGAGVNGAVICMALQTDGMLLAGGNFAIPRNGLARFGTNGALDNGYNPSSGLGGGAQAMVVLPDGRILIGGNFNTVNGITRPRIARLFADGSVDGTFNAGTGPNSVIYAIVRQPDGKLLIGGNFTNYNGTARKGIARLNSDGALDTSFDPGAGVDNEVQAIVLQPDGKVVIGGVWNTVDLVPFRNIARLNSDGSLDLSFDPGTGANGYVRAMALQPDGKVLIAGDFQSYNNINRNYVARVNSDGSLDASFTIGSGASANILAMSLRTDGTILIGGWFTSFNGTPRNRIARLLPNGSNDASFAPGIGAENAVLSIKEQYDGKVLIGGYFISVNGVSRPRLARLNVNGSLDNSFDPGTGVPGTGYSGSITTMAVQSNGKVLISGSFTSYNGTGRNRLARVNAEPPCSTIVELEFSTDGGGLRWALHDAGSNAVVQSSPGYPGYYNPPASPDYTETTCLPDGEFYFVFEDENCDGIVNGGYIVRVGGKRVIDNRSNLNNGCPSQIAGNTGVNVPVGNDRLISASCDRLELRRGVNANCSDRLTADNTPNGTSGNVYQFWIYEPNGGLSIRYPANGPGSNQVSMAALPSLAEGTMYNVRVRTRIAPGQWRAWGSACRMRIDNTLGQCGAAALVDDLSNANHSCGKNITLPAGNSSGAANRVVCMPVTRYNNNCVNVQANKYQFRFRIPAENVVIVRNSNTNFTHMHTSDGFAECKTYEVEVRASFNSGTTWCRGGVDPVDDLTPWGKVCEVYTGGCDEEFVGNHHLLGADQSEQSEGIHMYPNPNRGDQLFLSLDAIEEGVHTVSVDIYDAFGKRVSARTIAVNPLGSGSGGFINTVLELNGELATGLYMVHITAGDAVYTERLVIQK